jgi:predicted Zn finger-like uncharacterized protein
MRIACPACETAYDVPDSVVAAGRVLRCARCRHEWTPSDTANQKPEPEPDAAEPPAPPEFVAVAPPPPDDPLPFIRAPTMEPPRPRRAVMAGWVASAAALGLFAWCIIAWRQPIMRHWPPSERLFSALGYR